MSKDFDPDEFKRRVKEQLTVSRIAFKGKYRDELIQLVGLSREEIDGITPGVISIQKYDELIAVVKEASRVNLAQAELGKQIKTLGTVAVSIAKRVPAFAQLL
jgi:hypothetical protein